jgi:hypothetical protein
VQSKFSKQTLCRAFGACLLLAVGMACSAARAQDAAVPPFNEVHTIAVPGTPTPVEHDFTVTTTGPYQVVLIDLGAQLPTPAPLASVTLVVTTGNAIVGKMLVGPGTLQFNAAAAGTYTVHVVGTPGAGAGSGPIGIQIGTATSPASVGSYSDNIAVPAGTVSNGEAVLDDSFTVATSGSYTLSLADLQLPQSLGTLTLALTAQGSPTVLQILPDPNNNATQATVSLQSGVTYRVTAAGLVASGATGGLFSAVVVPAGGGSPVYGNAVPVGATTLVGTPALTAGGHTLTLTDLAFPAALTQVGAAVVLTGQSALASPLTAAGTQTFSAAGGTYQVFGVATPQTTSPAAGGYSIQIQPAGSGTPELSVARTVTGSGSGLSAYSFDTTLASAGNYAVGLQDFSFPVAFNSLRMAAVQGGALVGTPLISSGTLNASAVQAGPITLLVFSQPDPSHGGVFDVNITAAGSTTLLFDATQGAGAGFIARKVSIVTAGSYGISSSDLGFPAAFSNLAVIVTQGSNNLGSVFSLGNVSLSNAAPGDYFINVIAQPSGNAGTYALSMSAAPTVSLTPSAASVTQGGTVTLTWSSQNATTCTATGGWSGTQAVSGTVQSSALSATTTFTLACTGPGGTSTVSATVTATSTPAKSGGGGGGEIDNMLVLGLSVMIVRRLLRARGK